MQIQFFSESIDFSLEKPEEVQQWLLKTIEQENNSCENINVIFCSDEYLLNINKEYLQHDYYTDIITFQYEGNPIEGDLFISIDTVKDNAKDNNVTFNKELSRVIVHGVLHLLGYKDKSEKDQEEMTSKENFYLSLLE